MVNVLSALVAQVFHTSVAGSGNDVVANMQRTVAHQDSGHISASLVERRLNDSAGGIAVGIGFQLQHVGFEQYLFQ